MLTVSIPGRRTSRSLKSRPDILGHSVANGSLSWSATWVPHAGCLSGEGAAPGVRHEPALEAEPVGQPESDGCLVSRSAVFDQRCAGGVDRKSTRLNSSH